MREKTLNWIGVALIGICFVLSLGRILMAKKQTGDKKVIRIAHLQLEGGVRSTLDKLAAEYMRKHPDVEIIQIAIPQKIFTNWLITQLVGGTAPDIIELSGVTEERLVRYFHPLTDEMNRPNPYNEGTELANVPLRSTFFDGGAAGYSSVLLEYFGISISGFTNRAYYNLDLLKQAVGSEKIPQSYEEFLSACESLDAYSRRIEKPLIAVAGSKYNGPMIMNQLFSSQTQKLLGTLMPPAYSSPNGLRIADAYLQGKWSLESPQVTDGLNLMREVAQKMQPGFMQVQREDAMFYFVQGRALCFVSGSWDVTSIREQAPFRVGIGEIPMPSVNNPRYGGNVMGRFSEAGINAGIQFGITRNSEHPEIARDFLLFMAGKEMQELWTKESGWIPAVVGVLPSPQAAPFMPKTDGYVGGFALTNAGGADLNRIIDNNFYLLISPFGGGASFRDAIEKSFRKSLLSDLRRDNQRQLMSSRRTDGILCGMAWMAGKSPGDEDGFARKYDLLIQAGNARDRAFYMTRAILLRAGEATE